jgi:non-homologous end joining protein Ku
MSRKVSRQPENWELRKCYYSNKRKLHKLVKHKLAKQKEQFAKELSTPNSDPKKLWQTLEKLQNCVHRKKEEKK